MEVTQLNPTTYQAKTPAGDLAEIGDIKAIDFKPTLKLNRFESECYQSIVLPTTVKGSYTFDGNKYLWTGLDSDVGIYTLDRVEKWDGLKLTGVQNELGGFEFEIILRGIPASNKFLIDIDSKGLDFFYQPQLTLMEIAQGFHQPDNAIGSYAVYHSTKGIWHPNKADGVKYKSGKAFHIYRPKAIDAVGKEIWGELSLNAGELTITIDRTWLKLATYPVIIDPNFGYESTGTNDFGQNNQIWGLAEEACPYVGTVDTMEMCIYGFYAENGKGALYDAAEDIVVNGLTNTVVGANLGWYSVPFTTPPDVTAQNYHIVMWTDAAVTMKYDVTTGKAIYSWGVTYNGFPASAAGQGTRHATIRISVYCTVTEAAVGHPYTSRVQGVQGMRTWGGI